VNDRQRLLVEVNDVSHTLIFLETPKRILSSLNAMMEVMGDRKIAVARELTKMHEEIYRGTISEAVKHFSTKTPRGEFTIVLAGNDKQPRIWSAGEVEAELLNRVAKGEAAAAIAKQVAGVSGWSRRDVYDLLNRLT
jgi:16S rRNA (cytidine1402-2'-O)-methyltransferase